MSQQQRNKKDKSKNKHHNNQQNEDNDNKQHYQQDDYHNNDEYDQEIQLRLKQQLKNNVVSTKDQYKQSKRNKQLQNHIGYSDAQQPNNAFYTPSPNKKHKIDSSGGSGNNHMHDILMPNNQPVNKDSSDSLNQLPLNQQDVESYKNFNPDRRRQQLMDLFSSYERREETNEDISPVGKIGYFNQSSKNSSLTKINKDIRKQKEQDLQGNNIGGLAKYQMMERLITEQVKDEYEDDIDYKKLSSQRKASYVPRNNQILEENEDDEYEERKTLEGQFDLSNPKDTTLKTDTDLQYTGFQDITQSLVDYQNETDLNKLQKNPAFANQMNKLLSLYQQNQDKAVKKETIMAQQPALHQFNSVQGGIGSQENDKNQNQLMLEQDDSYTLFPERYVNNYEFPFLYKNNLNPLVFSMDYLFVEMRKEYMRQMLISLPDYQLGLGFEKDSKVPQELIDKDNQFFLSLTKIRQFNHLFKQIYPLKDKNRKASSGDDKGSQALSALTSQLFKQKKNVKQVKNQTNKLIFILFSFDLKEIHRLFRKFYLEIDKDENMTFELDEMIDCFEMFSQEDMLGKRLMKKVLKSIGANFQGGLISIFKEGQITNMSFPPEIYEQIFQIMQHEGQDYIDFFNFMPYLQLFFFGKLFSGVEKREKYFKELLDQQAKNGLYQSFIRSGLQQKNLYEKNITYRMVEKVVMDIRGYYQGSFGFDQTENVLRQVQQKMQVDPISLLEREKQSYLETNPNVQSFSQWLAYIIGLQLMWSELRKRELEYKDQSKERLAFEFLFEERLWKLASQLDYFNLKYFPDLIVKGIQKRVLERNTNILESKGNRQVNQLGQIDENCYFLYDFTESLTEVFKQYCPWVKYQVIERALYYYIWNLIHKSNINRYKTKGALNGVPQHYRQPTFSQQQNMPGLEKNKYDIILTRIFGSLYENDSKRMGLFQKLSKIKFMRFIKIETDAYVLSRLCDKILYQDCKRIMNEHAIKLLIDGQLNYNRTTEDINDIDKNYFLGIPEQVSKKQQDYMATGLSVIPELLSSQQDSGSNNPGGQTTTDSDLTDGHQNDTGQMKKVKMKGIEDHRKRMAAKKKFMKKFSGDTIADQSNEFKDPQIQDDSQKQIVQNSMQDKTNKEEETKKKDLIGVMLTSKVLGDPYKKINEDEKDQQKSKKKGQMITQNAPLDNQDITTQFFSNSTKNADKKLLRESDFVPEEVYNQGKKFDKIELYKKVDRNQLLQQFKDFDEQSQSDHQFDADQTFNGGTPGIKKTNINGSILYGKNNGDYKFNRDQPRKQTKGSQKNKITFDKKEDAQHLKEQRRIMNAKKLKSQMLNEIYRNELEFKDDDYNRSCMRGCDNPQCKIF